MSNVVDFAKIANAKNLKQRIAKMADAGLSADDITILRWASNAAFSQNDISIQQAIELEIEESHLKYLSIAYSEDPSVDVFTIGGEDLSVLVYSISRSNLTFEWHEEDAIGKNLTTVDHPGQHVSDFIMEHTTQLGMDAFNVFGLFTHYAFFFSCLSSFNPLHIQYFPDTQRIGLVLYDPKRGVDLALVTDLNQWKCRPEDWAREIRTTESK